MLASKFIQVTAFTQKKLFTLWKTIFSHGKLFLFNGKFSSNFLLWKICSSMKENIFHQGKYFSLKENIFLKKKTFFRDGQIFFYDGKIQDFQFSLMENRFFLPGKIFSMGEKYHFQKYLSHGSSLLSASAWGLTVRSWIQNS
jgi:hypothetical protein